MELGLDACKLLCNILFPVYHGVAAGSEVLGLLGCVVAVLFELPGVGAELLEGCSEFIGVRARDARGVGGRAQLVCARVRRCELQLHLRDLGSELVVLLILASAVWGLQSCSCTPGQPA